MTWGYPVPRRGRRRDRPPLEVKQGRLRMPVPVSCGGPLAVFCGTLEWIVRSDVAPSREVRSGGTALLR